MNDIYFYEMAMLIYGKNYLKNIWKIMWKIIWKMSWEHPNQQLWPFFFGNLPCFSTGFVSSRIGLESSTKYFQYVKFVRILIFLGPFSVGMWMRGNKDQKNSKYGHFSRSVCIRVISRVVKRLKKLGSVRKLGSIRKTLV